MASVSKFLIMALSMASFSVAVPLNGEVELQSRAACTFNTGQAGTCITTAACQSQGGTSEAGHCPGASNIQCCTLERVCAAPEVNTATITMIQSLEGFQPRPYPDAGKYSIGYGHQCSQPFCAEMTVPIDQAEGVRLMTNDLGRFRKCVNSKIGSVALNENQYGALISWTYNIGCANMQSSTLATRLLNQEDPNTVAEEELPKWRMSQGQVSQVLVRRRQTEIALFETPSDVMVLPVAC